MIDGSGMLYVALGLLIYAWVSDEVTFKFSGNMGDVTKADIHERPQTVEQAKRRYADRDDYSESDLENDLDRLLDGQKDDSTDEHIDFFGVRRSSTREDKVKE